MYLDKSEREDDEIMDRWRTDIEGILIFVSARPSIFGIYVYKHMPKTGLFAATVTLFIIESYKKLFPDSTDTTNALLAQISQQLGNISNGTPLAVVAVQNSQPFKPTASAVRVNVMWFLSLVLNLTCAIIAMLMQQWVRRYLGLVRHYDAPHKRARMRAYIFRGTKVFKMTQAIEIIPTLLHISAFLFFAGLVDFFIPINTAVAYTMLGSIVVFTLAYIILTVLPNLFLDCPYRTPLSGFTWHISQLFILRNFVAIRGIEGVFHRILSTLWDWPTKWRKMLDYQINMHRKWLKDGFQTSVELSVNGAPPIVDTEALQWTLSSLEKDKEIEEFADRVPGFFDSHTVPDPAAAILSLMSDNPTTDPILGSRLRYLLKTCFSGTSPLDKRERRRRLWVCLKSLWYCGRAYNRPENVGPLPSYVRDVLASPDFTYQIQKEEDLDVRMIGRCFGTLVVKKLSTDINSRKSTTIRVSDAELELELECLSAILGTEKSEVATMLGQPGAVELATILSLTTADAEPLFSDTMSSDALDILKQTLHILSQALLATNLADLPPLLVEQFHKTCKTLNQWFKDELRETSDRLLQSSSTAQEGPVNFPSGSRADISPVSR